MGVVNKIIDCTSSCFTKSNIQRILVLIILSILGIFVFSISRPKIALYKIGKFIGFGNGHHGDIIVEVETDTYNILDINIIKEQEMPIISKIVYKEIPAKMIRKNKAKVDIVAGATFTSDGLIEAVEDALEQAYLKNEE